MKPLYSTDDTKRYISELSSVEPWRDEFRRDFARVIHSPSFRRLQGKTQLFPGAESDYFRNRLTHSLEVGQIAESIACRINATSKYFQLNPINPRICLTAALLHDIGHPPFGHNGEEALDEMMRPYGGFEGNAQTLRIVSQLEKKRYTEEDCPLKRRAGLNLTYRTMGAILKYDKSIELDRTDDFQVRKGYYSEDLDIVRDIKTAVGRGVRRRKKFKTIECSIMDIADDIAYSTYDLEDSFKAGFLTPGKILTTDINVLRKVAKKVGADAGLGEFSAADVIKVFLEIFESQIQIPNDLSPNTDDTESEKILSALGIAERLDSIASDGNVRTQFTSELVGKFISGVSVVLDRKNPQFSSIIVDKDILKQIEVLKNYTYEATIYSSRVKISEYRGKDIVTGIFDALSKGKGFLLLPEDVLGLHRAAQGDVQKEMRVISDFIAGMTDRYAVEFYSRLYSDGGQNLFKPL